MRSALVGMRLAEELRLSAADRSALFYALLLKDLGCSSNAAKMAYLFGADDHSVKRSRPDGRLDKGRRMRSSIAGGQCRPAARCWRSC